MRANMQVPYEVGGVLGLWHLGTVDSVEFDAAAAVHAKWASLWAPACNSILTQINRRASGPMVC